MGTDDRVDTTDADTQPIHRRDVWADGIPRLGPAHTAKMLAVERRILDDQTWWQEHRAGVIEAVELFLVRVSVAGMMLVLLTVAELLGPVPYLECRYQNRSVSEVMTCEYRVDAWP